MSLSSLFFLAPLGLIGLAAIAVPIYLHMRHKPRAEIYPFPAIDFLLRAQKKKKRRFRAEQLLLMLFRIGVICLLAFLFSRPFIENRAAGAAASAGQPLVLILDDSASMSAVHDGKRFFDEAKDQIADLLKGRPAGAPTHLITAVSPTRHARLANTTMVRDVLPEVRPTSYTATLDAAYAEAVALIEREGYDGATMRIFTDGSRTAWAELPSGKPEKADVIYSSLRPDDFENVSIVDVDQAPGDANSIEVSLFNSNPEATEIPLDVRGGPRAMSQRLRLEAGAPASHYFALGDPVPATMNVRIPDDGFPLDNEIVFAPQVNRAIRILIVDGDTHPDAVRNESFFLRNALGGDESDRYGYSLEMVTLAGMTSAKIEAADVIFLLNLEVPSESLLQDALAKGKGLFVGMGERMIFERWNAFFSEYDLEMWEASRLPAPTPIDLEDIDHPMFHPVEEYAWRSFLRDVRIEQVRIMSLGRASYDVPLAMPSGAPLLLAQDLRPGRMMIWTSSMDIDWNNFPLELGFVPFVRQVTAWLAGRESGNSYQTLTANQVRDQGLVDSLSLKHTPDVFRRSDLEGPKPGIYTLQQENRTQFVRIKLDPAETDFRDFAAVSAEAEDDPLAAIGFRAYLRADLAPSIQWWLFALILVETLTAARVTSRWGDR